MTEEGTRKAEGRDGILCELLLDRLSTAIAVADRDRIMDISDVLSRADRLPRGIDATTAAEIQDIVGQWLSVAADASAAEAHARAVRLLTAVPEADPALMFDQIEALKTIALKGGDRDGAIAMVRSEIALARVHDGMASRRLAGALVELIKLLREAAESSTYIDPKMESRYLREIEVAESELEAVEALWSDRRDELSVGPREAWGDRGRKAAPERTAYHDPFKVLFCTSRRLDPRAGVFKMFDGTEEPYRAGFEGHYGIAEVMVPKERDIGQNLIADRRYAGLYVPWLGEGRFRYILDAVDMPKQWSVVAAEIAAQRRKSASHAKFPEALVYVHGYNTRFHEAMERAAQLGSDLDIAGPVAAYSWPSVGKTRGFSHDVMMHNSTNVRHLVGLIDRVRALASSISSDAAGPPRVTLIGHSLGCKFLLDAVERLAEQHRTQLFTDVIFASPAELQASHFVDVLSRSRSLAERVTVYCSSADRVLSLRHFPVIGAETPVVGFDRVTLAQHIALHDGLGERVDVIETSAISNQYGGWWGLGGHSDYATTAIDDVRMRLWLHADASQRELLLLELTDGPARYWQSRLLDDGTTGDQRWNPGYLSERNAARRAIESVRGHGSVGTAIDHHTAEFKRLTLAGGERRAEAEFNRRMLRTLDRISSGMGQRAHAG